MRRPCYTAHPAVHAGFTASRCCFWPAGAAILSLYLSVVGQVVGTVHELLQGASRPVGALVAGGQLLGRRGSPVTHVEGGLPRRAALHVTPLAEVSRHRVPQEGDVVELPV